MGSNFESHSSKNSKELVAAHEFQSLKTEMEDKMGGNVAARFLFEGAMFRDP